MPVALLANIHPNDVVGNDILITLEHLEIGEELVPALNFARLVDDELIREKVRAALVGCGKVGILDGIKHVKEDLLLVRCKSRGWLVEDAAVDLGDVVVALVHLELEECPANIADSAIGRVKAARC